MIKQKGIIVLILLVIVLLVAYVFYTRNGNKPLTENFNTDVQFQNKSAHFTSGFSKLKIPNQELNTSNGITICFWAKDLNNGIKYPLNIIKDGDDTKYLEIALVIQYKRLQLKMGNSWLASDEIKFPIDDDTYSENFGDNSKKNDWYFFAFKLNDNNTC